MSAEPTAPIDFREFEHPVACVDIGGTKVAVSVFDRSGMRARVSEPTVKRGERDALARQVTRMIEQVCRESAIAPREIGDVGVSSCGPFVLREGLAEIAAPNICGVGNDWVSVPLERQLAQSFARVRMENDAVGALEAERRWGALRDARGPLGHCAYVTWSTGIGVGLCVDARVLRGKNGNAGHAGHSFASDGHALCGCGNDGDVEGLASGTALARRFASQGYGDAAMLMSACRDGRPETCALVDEACRVVGRMLFNLVATLDLERISIGGSVFCNNQDLLLPRLRAHVEGFLPALTAGCDLVRAGLGERVGDFAALALVAPASGPKKPQNI